MGAVEYLLTSIRAPAEQLDYNYTGGADFDGCSYFHLTASLSALSCSVPFSRTWYRRHSQACRWAR